jgi:DNA processing protein
MNEWKKWEIKELDKKDFPKGLREISKPPEKIYYRGEWDSRLFDKTITIVGSRRVTKYGRDIIEKIVPALVSENITIISGFMYGVDAECHSQCLENGGKTVAVVGGGLDMVNTYYNEQLYSQILKNKGVVISEFEPAFKPTVWSFPQRDRIMSALATIGVLVIEGGIKSGSLITAKFALKQNKKIYAIPGPINSTVSEGTNWLIKSGAAKMVTDIGDILTDYRGSPEQVGLFKDYSDLSELEKKIVKILENEAVTTDELCHKISSPISEINRCISKMLIRDLIEEEGGKIYLS